MTYRELTYEVAGDVADVGCPPASASELFRTEDRREGVAAFLENRDPRYVGR